MSQVLKLDRHNEKEEILFELKYQLSLTTRQRFEMMLGKSKEVRELLEKSGHRKPFEIIKRTEGSGRPDELENLFLQKIRKIKHRKKKE
ncbi:MAG: hypothetical protein HZA07_03585 [Nitrospirae bacterium]|nr:hypothetical protein [Nitrospirota bacterium]